MIGFPKQVHKENFYISFWILFGVIYVTRGGVMLNVYATKRLIRNH